MKKITFISILGGALLLASCASWTGGSDYVVKITRPDGSIIKGQAHDSSSADEIAFSMTANEEGAITGMTLNKKVVVPGEGYAPVMQDLIKLIPVK